MRETLVLDSSISQGDGQELGAVTRAAGECSSDRRVLLRIQLHAHCSLTAVAGAIGSNARRQCHSFSAAGQATRATKQAQPCSRTVIVLTIVSRVAILMERQRNNGCEDVWLVREEGLKRRELCACVAEGEGGIRRKRG